MTRGGAVDLQTVSAAGADWSRFYLELQVQHAHGVYPIALARC